MSQKIDKTDGSSNSSSDASAVEKVFGIDEVFSNNKQDNF